MHGGPIQADYQVIRKRTFEEHAKRSPPPSPRDHVGHAENSDSQEHSVPQKVFLEWVRNQLESEESCLQLPLTIILVISFMILANLHQQNEKIFAVEEAIEFDIAENANFAFAGYFGHKGINDVNSIADFWSWTRLGFLPVMMTSLSGYGYSEGLGSHDSNYNVSNLPTEIPYSTYDGRSVPIRGDYLHFNRIVGGIRFRQEITEMSKDFCVPPRSIDPDSFSSWYQKSCSQFSPWPFNLPPEYSHAESYARTGSDASESGYAREEWLLLESDYPLEMKLIDMEDGCQNIPEDEMGTKSRPCLCTWCQTESPPRPWIGEMTERVEISIVIYNPVYGIYVLCGVNFFFNRAGHIHKLIHVQSSWGDPLHLDDPSTAGLMFAMDAVWVISLIYIALKELLEIGTIIRRKGLRGIWYNYISFWNVVDWISMICAAIMIGNFFSLLEVGATTDKAFQALIDEGSTEERIRNVYEEVSVLVRFEREVRQWLVFYPGIIMLRLFKAFAAQPRLAVVTETLNTAWQDIFHFCIVFLSIFVSFTIAGHILFGQDLEGFATLDRSFLTCFRCMLGDFDWDAFESIGRAPAGVWFGFFMAIVNILLLNMSMAIVMSAYDEVRLKAGNAQTLIEQIVDIARRTRENRKGLRVSLGEVDKAFEVQEPDEDTRMSSETPLTKQVLIDVVQHYRGKSMTEKQAQRVLKKSEQWYQKHAEEEAAEEGGDASAETPSDAQLSQHLGYLVSEVQSLRETLILGNGATSGSAASLFSRMAGGQAGPKSSSRGLNMGDVELRLGKLEERVRGFEDHGIVVEGNSPGDSGRCLANFCGVGARGIPEPEGLPDIHGGAAHSRKPMGPQPPHAAPKNEYFPDDKARGSGF